MINIRRFGISMFSRMPLSNNGINFFSYHPPWSITWRFSLQWHRTSPAWKSDMRFLYAHINRKPYGCALVGGRWFGRLSFNWQPTMSKPSAVDAGEARGEVGEL